MTFYGVCLINALEWDVSLLIQFTNCCKPYIDGRVMPVVSMCWSVSGWGDTKRMEVVELFTCSAAKSKEVCHPCHGARRRDTLWCPSRIGLIFSHGRCPIQVAAPLLWWYCGRMWQWLMALWIYLILFSRWGTLLCHHRRYLGLSTQPRNHEVSRCPNIGP